MFIENTLALEITMSAVISTAKLHEVIFRDKFGVVQHNKVLRKMQSLVLRLKKLFSSQDIIEQYFALRHRIDFTFKNTC